MPWIIALCLVCSGCVTLERSAPERHYFVIELPQSAHSPEAAELRFTDTVRYQLAAGSPRGDVGAYAGPFAARLIK